MLLVELEFQKKGFAYEEGFNTILPGSQAREIILFMKKIGFWYPGSVASDGVELLPQHIDFIDANIVGMPYLADGTFTPLLGFAKIDNTDSPMFFALTVYAGSTLVCVYKLPDRLISFYKLEYTDFVRKSIDIRAFKATVEALNCLPFSFPEIMQLDYSISLLPLDDYLVEDSFALGV